MFDSSSSEDEALLLWSLEESKKKRRYWTHPINIERSEKGELSVLLPDLLEDEERFFIYFRMSVNSFNELHNYIKHEIEKQNTNWRNSISTKERLAVFLR